ncbi:hypothetical protein INR49_019830 [Caranx melampygus]|nr:hypothetical protein INR49_019830 [Caranx melampygus]
MRLSTFNSPSAIFKLMLYSVGRFDSTSLTPEGAVVKETLERRSQVTLHPIRRPRTANTAASHTGTVSGLPEVGGRTVLCTVGAGVVVGELGKLFILMLVEWEMDCGLCMPQRENDRHLSVTAMHRTCKGSALLTPGGAGTHRLDRMLIVVGSHSAGRNS